MPAEAKARIVQESRQPGAVVSEVARRHELSPQQLFGWRREARGDLADGGDDACGLPRPTATPFVPIVVATAADHPEEIAGIAAGGGQSRHEHLHTVSWSNHGARGDRIP
jgi:transposase